MIATNTAFDSFDHDPLLECTLGGRYRIERLIGRGGVGLVYLAQDVEQGRPVVVKVLAPHWAADADAVARFERETLRMAQLQHPNVVEMYDHGDFEGRTYIVMEFIRGEPLRRYLNRRRRLPLEDFIPIALQILQGAGYVHERGIMMRDIKPPNIMICEHEGRANHVKMLDFGLAKLVDEDEADGTRAHVIGTAAYMSPEQIKGEAIDVRVDVYALGVLFFLMLTGEHPISGDNDAAVLVNHVHGRPKSLAERLPKGHRLPPELIALIESCLAKDPNERPANATAMAQMLRERFPASTFELPRASLKTRAPAETYWAARMHSGPAAVQALQADVSDSAEWTRPLLRRAAQTGQAPLELAEAEIAAQRELVQRPMPGRRRAALAAPLPRPHSPSTPVSVADSPSSATVRVTAADAREAVERLEQSHQRDEPDDGLESEPTGRHATIPPGLKSPESASEESDPAPISMDDEVEEIEALTPSSHSDDDPRLVRSGLHAYPTAPSGPMTTDAMTMTSGPYRVHRRTPTDGVRLGAIVAVAGLAALALGGLCAVLVLGGRADDASVAMASVAAASTPVAPTPVAPAPALGRVEIRAIEGARIEIDGKDHGVAPRSVELLRGTHQIRVVADGHHPWQTTVDIKPGVSAVVEAELRAISSVDSAAESGAPSRAERPEP